MKTIKCIVQIGCIWVAMNVYTQTVRLTKDMLEATHIYVSTKEPIREETGKKTKDLSRTAADEFKDSVIIGVEIGNCPTWIDTVFRLLPTTSEPFRENIDDVY